MSSSSGFHHFKEAAGKINCKYKEWKKHAQQSTEHDAGLLWLCAELGGYTSAFGDAATPWVTINLVHPHELNSANLHQGVENPNLLCTAG